jgi:hypothetical protein
MEPSTFSEAEELPAGLTGLRCLEWDYFRVARPRWELIGLRLCQLGANAVFTRLPWAWHQPAADLLDLAGAIDPERDLVGFLELCAEERLSVIAHIGPYVGGGILGGGVPAWLWQDHPEIMALDRELTPQRSSDLGGPLPSPEHPTYLRHVADWYRQLAVALAALQVPGGPIVAIRVGGPADYDWSPAAAGQEPGWDYNPHVTRVLWPIWLRQKYRTLQALNAAWGTDFRTFGEGAFPGQLSGADRQDSPAYADAIQFVRRAAPHAEASYARLARQQGWQVPIITSQAVPAWPGLEVPEGAEPTSAAGAPDRPPAAPLSHVTQVDSEPAGLGAALRWAPDAPLRADGHPRRRFWQLKVAGWQTPAGIRSEPGALLVTGPDSRRLRLPRPAWPALAAYRLMLDGRLLDAAARGRRSRLALDYVAEDDDGPTDLYVICEAPSASLAAYLESYLRSLLRARSLILKRAASLCQALATDLNTAGSSAGPPPALTPEITAAQLSLRQARQVARRAAGSLEQLEKWIGTGLPSAPGTAFDLPDLAGLPAVQLERIVQLGDACAGTAAALTELLSTLTLATQADGEGLSLQTYRSIDQQRHEASRESVERLAGHLTWLRIELAAGALPTAAWSVHDRLATILHLLTAG